MNQKLEDTTYEAYTYPYMKKNLQEHFGERLIQTEINGKQNVVTFRTTARVVLQDYYSKQQQKQDTAEEKIKLVQAAAKLIKEDIKAVETAHEVYPHCNDLTSQEAGIEYLPNTLLKELFAEKKAGVKMASIGQAMMQATRPRVLLAPLQFGLGVQLYHQFSSRFLIDSLHHHGFFAVPTKKCSGLSIMLLSHMELTFPTCPQNSSIMELTTLTTTSARWHLPWYGHDCCHYSGNQFRAVNPQSKSNLS